MENSNEEQRFLGPKQTYQKPNQDTNSNEETLAPCTAKIYENNDMRVLGTFNLNIENPNSEQRLLGLKKLTEINVNIPNSNEEPPVSSTAMI